MCLSNGRWQMRGGRRQQGYLMPLAAFILVVMGLMAATLARTTAQTGISVTQEAVTLQTFYAAESGAQRGMNQLFYDTANPLTRAAADGRCTGMNITNNLTATGLGNCSVTTTCALNTAINASFYTVTAAASCGSGELTSARTIQVSAFLE